MDIETVGFSSVGANENLHRSCIFCHGKLTRLGSGNMNLLTSSFIPVTSLMVVVAGIHAMVAIGATPDVLERPAAST